MHFFRLHLCFGSGIGWTACCTTRSPKRQDLCRHNFGHHVVQSVLEHGHEKHRKVVANILKADLLSFAKHRNASYLVEKALSYCAVEAPETTGPRVWFCPRKLLLIAVSEMASENCMAAWILTDSGRFSMIGSRSFPVFANQFTIPLLVNPITSHSNTIFLWFPEGLGSTTNQFTIPLIIKPW